MNWNFLSFAFIAGINSKKNKKNYNHLKFDLNFIVNFIWPNNILETYAVHIIMYDIEWDYADFLVYFNIFEAFSMLKNALHDLHYIHYSTPQWASAKPPWTSLPYVTVNQHFNTAHIFLRRSFTKTRLSRNFMENKSRTVIYDKMDVVNTSALDVD